jgi:hypothetical protein
MVVGWAQQWIGHSGASRGLYSLRGGKKERTWSRDPNGLLSTTHPYAMNH